MMIVVAGPRASWIGMNAPDMLQGRIRQFSKLSNRVIGAAIECTG